MRLRRFWWMIPGGLAFVLVLAMAASTANSAEPEGRKYLLERVGDSAVAQIYADGFKDLPLKEKLLIWHLYQASLAGRDIYYDQRHAKSLIMRDVIEAVVAHPAGIDPKALEEITLYAKLFWINSGPYNNLTARKFVLEMPSQDFAAAVKQAVKNGAKIDLNAGETLDGTLKSLEPMFFDPNFEPIVTNKSPGPGKDILATSANNLYVGVSMKDLAGFEEKYGLNSRLVKKNGKLAEEVYKVGGLYGDQISRIVAHLGKAKEFATPPMAEALEALIRWYTTGEDEDRRKYDIAWVKDKASPVDTINGFIEVYMDARGVKGGWESAVFFVNQEKTGEIKKIAAEAQWFEDHMPWLPKYRKANVKGITANAIEVVIETGDCGPVTPIGINLPNDQAIRESHGSKSVSLANVLLASEKSSPTTMRAEFSWTPEEAARAAKWSTLSGELLVNMHEVIGHASGKVSDSVKGKPQDTIKEYFSALEEGRADLVALYFMPDPRLAELGLIKGADQAEMAQAAYEGYARNALVQLRRVRQGDQIEEDHMRNRQMVVHWLIANTKSVEVRKRDGKTYYVVTDPKAFRDGVGKLLAEVQRIKAEGDYEGAKALFETHGIHFETKLRDEVVSRVSELKLPSYTAYVMPKLEPVKGPGGTITDVAISYPMDLTKQMLEYSAFAKEGR